jgi:hypothetical protein
MASKEKAVATKPKPKKIKQDELITVLAKETGIHVDAVKLVLKALWPEITVRILRGESFLLPGVMEAYVAEHEGFFAAINVGKRKGEKIWIEPYKKMKFIEKNLMVVRLNPDNNFRKRFKDKYAETVKWKDERNKTDNKK